MKISVLIPTFNRRSLLERTLPSVLAQQFAVEQFEIIVVVDGSTDGTVAWLRSLRPACTLRVIEQPNCGRIQARNAAFQAAQGELLLILDDDIICPPNLLTEHAAAHSSCDRLVAFGANAVSDESPRTIFTDWARATFAEWRAELERDPTPKWPYHATLDANFSLPRALINEFGGYDTRFLTRELELGLRLWKGGVRFQFLPRATAYHVYDKGDDMVEVDAGPYGREEVLLCRTHPAYRANSAFAAMERGNAVMRRFRSFLSRLPFPADIFLRPVFDMTAMLRGMDRAAIRLLQLRQSTAMLRGAAREIGSWSNFREEFGQRLPILAYHHIGSVRPGTHPGLTVSPEHFKRQLKLLLQFGYNPISPQQWSAWVKRGTRLPYRPVLITFDDAYADLADYALPVLLKYGYAAVVFAVTGALGGTNVWDERVGWGTHRIMSGEQVRYWASRGIEFGAHGHTHADLTTLDDVVLEEEVTRSKRELAAILGRNPQAFAYPDGEYDERVAACVGAHFECAFTTDPGWNTLGNNLLQLRRYVVDPNDGWIGLGVRLWLDPVQRIRVFLALRSRLRRIVTSEKSRAGAIAHAG